jgi:ectoine hydroxylase
VNTVLSPKDIYEYNEQGFIFKHSYISTEVTDKIVDEIQSLRLDNPGIVFEKDGKTPRAIQGAHLFNETLRKVTQFSPILSIAKQLLGNDVYLHQFRINYKQAFEGAAWPWHQEFPYWKGQDKIPEPKLVNVIIFLDEVTEFNGPLIVIPRSHSVGTLDNPEHLYINTAEKGDWKENYSSTLKFVIRREIVKEQVAKHGMKSVKGCTGSTLFFNSEIFHASGSNISPFQRRFLILTYNDVSNLPTGESERPKFIAGRDFTPLTELNTI